MQFKILYSGKICQSQRWTKDFLQRWKSWIRSSLASLTYSKYWIISYRKETLDGNRKILNKSIRLDGNKKNTQE